MCHRWATNRRRALGCLWRIPTSSAWFWFDLRQRTRFLSTPFIAAPLSLVFIVWAGPSATHGRACLPASICKHSIWHQTNTKIGIHTRLAGCGCQRSQSSCDTQKIPSVAAGGRRVKALCKRKGKTVIPAPLFLSEFLTLIAIKCVRLLTFRVMRWGSGNYFLFSQLIWNLRCRQIKCLEFQNVIIIFCHRSIFLMRLKFIYCESHGMRSFTCYITFYWHKAAECFACVLTTA